MTRIVTNLKEASDLLNDYLLEERPLNLVEMRHLTDIINCIKMQASIVCTWIDRNRPKMDGLTQVQYSNLRHNLGTSGLRI